MQRTNFPLGINKSVYSSSPVSPSPTARVLYTRLSVALLKNNKKSRNLVTSLPR